MRPYDLFCLGSDMGVNRHMGHSRDIPPREGCGVGFLTCYINIHIPCLAWSPTLKY